ncbi:hypothetical protein MetexDRAFT_2834 [Methylorubrum extorquens DSM 13060]|uniref:Uncharacterized protein n=1 Tax=Methylorubrum extorquens DSM 13060 TaxID=882800 RepID=H1KJM2_METEX|nr:hypothetical protein MetexDRAFT_2834 [Methylorubrum extorquens DSM 13060]
MLDYQCLTVTVIITGAVWCLYSALCSARKGWTWGAVLYLSVACAPLAVVAVRLDAKNANKHTPAQAQYYERQRLR